MFHICHVQELQDLGDIASTFPPTPELERITYYPNYPVGPRGAVKILYMIYITLYISIYLTHNTYYIYCHLKNLQVQSQATVKVKVSRKQSWLCS